jgi:hypothetical protein
VFFYTFTIAKIFRFSLKKRTEVDEDILKTAKELPRDE